MVDKMIKSIKLLTSENYVNEQKRPRKHVHESYQGIVEKTHFIISLLKNVHRFFFLYNKY